MPPKTNLEVGSCHTLLSSSMVVPPPPAATPTLPATQPSAASTVQPTVNSKSIAKAIPAAGSFRGYGTNPGDLGRPTDFWTGSFDINHSHKTKAHQPAGTNGAARPTQTFASSDPFVKKRQQQYGVPFYEQMKKKAAAAAAVATRDGSVSSPPSSPTPATVARPHRRLSSAMDHTHEGSIRSEETGSLTAHWPAAGKSVGGNAPVYHNYSSTRNHLDHGHGVVATGRPKDQQEHRRRSINATTSPSHGAGKRSSVDGMEYTPQHVKYTSHWEIAHATQAPNVTQTMSESNWMNEPNAAGTAAQCRPAGLKSTPGCNNLQIQRMLFPTNA